MESLNYVVSLVKRGHSLAKSSVTVLIPTAIIYYISTHSSFQATQITELEVSPTEFIFRTLESIELGGLWATFLIFMLILIKTLTILFASEDIYRLRRGERNRRYLDIMSLNQKGTVGKFLFLYALWNFLFFLVGLSIVIASDMVFEPKASWIFSIFSAAALFPVYYAGVSVFGFLSAATRAGDIIEGIREKVKKNVYRIYIFYFVRSFFDLGSMIGVPSVIIIFVHNPILYAVSCLVVLTPIILFIRTTSQFFKLDIFSPEGMQASHQL